MNGVPTVFCDDKFNKQAEKFGIQLGVAFDLRTGHNIDDPKVRKEIRRHVRVDKPDLVVGSPICGPWSSINFFNDPNTPNANRLLLNSPKSLMALSTVKPSTSINA